MSLSQLPFSQASLPQTQPSGSQGLSARASRIFDAIVNSSSKSSTSTTTTTTSSSTRTTFTSSSRTTSTSTTTGARRTARSQALFDAIISSKSLAGSEPSSSPNQTSITSNSSFRFGSPLGRRAHEPSSSPVTSRCSSPDELDSFINPTRKAKEASPSPSTGDPSSSSNTMMFFSKPKFFVDFGNGTVDMNDEPGAGSVVEKSEEYSRVNQPPTSILLSKSPKLKRKRVPSPELSATWLAKRQGMLSSVLREETNVKKTTNLISMDDVIEILDSDDEDYIPPPPKRQKTTTQIRHTRTSIKKVETIIEKDVTVLEIIDVDNSSTKIKAEPEPPLSQFFAKYPSFDHNPKVSSSQEFKRLSNQFGWTRATSREHGDEFGKAAVQQFDLLYGTSLQDLDSWRRFFEALGEEYCPASIEQCILAVRNIHINIMDLVDKPLSGKDIPRFPSEAELRTYSQRTGKFFPRKRVKDGSFLEFLLRRIRR